MELLRLVEIDSDKLLETEAEVDSERLLFCCSEELFEFCKDNAERIIEADVEIDSESESLREMELEPKDIDRLSDVEIEAEIVELPFAEFPVERTTDSLRLFDDDAEEDVESI